MSAPRVTPAAPTRTQWYATLAEWLDSAYVGAFVATLEDLRAAGLTPHGAAAYCRVHCYASDPTPAGYDGPHYSAAPHPADRYDGL